MRLIDCPETSAGNYYFMLRNISEGCGSHMTIWRCRPLFGSAWSDSKRCGLARSIAALRTRM